MTNGATAETMSLEKAFKIHEMTQTEGWSYLVAFLRNLEDRHEAVQFSEPTNENQFALHQAIGGSKTIRGIITLVSLASHTVGLASSEANPADSAE